MPLITNSTYKAPVIFRNAHLNTLYPALFRKIKNFETQNEREELPDGDFIDVEWLRQNSKKLLICLHGLEGSAKKHYIQGSMKLFAQNGFDALALYFRSCSDELNRLLPSYHSGFTQDLDFMIKKITAQKIYSEIIILGNSVGGNIALKYAGEQGSSIAPEIKKIIAFSVPIWLASCDVEISKWYNRLYLNNFMRTMREKAIAKDKLFPNILNIQKIKTAKFFADYDEYFTAPLNGYKDAAEYYAAASCAPYLEKITIPTLLVNALDDTFLSPDSFPRALAQSSKTFFLETPEHGGHLGFMSPDKNNFLWTDKRALQFATG